MRPASLAWRLGLSAVVAVILLIGQVHHTDEYFPFGAVAMFAQARDPEGTADDTCLEATQEGSDEPVTIPFGRGSVGIQRSDVESSLAAIRADPSRLQALVDARERLHPDEPPLTSLTVCADRYTMHRGGPVGPPERIALVTWEVPR